MFVFELSSNKDEKVRDCGWVPEAEAGLGLDPEEIRARGTQLRERALVLLPHCVFRKSHARLPALRALSGGRQIGEMTF